MWEFQKVCDNFVIELSYDNGKWNTVKHAYNEMPGAGDFTSF